MENKVFIETKTMTCKKCSLTEEVFLAGMYDQKNKKWVNKQGKAWNGRTCAVCHKDKIRTNMKEMRHKEKVLTNG